MSGNVNVRPNVLNLAERTSVSSKRTVRAPLTKKRSKGIPLSERVTLERVLGFTVKDNRTFACDPNTGLVVYTAGCVIVLFNPRRNKQSHIVNHSRKTITSLAISGDGKNIVSGECGHKPAVRVWDVEDRTQLAEFHGHKFGINCVAFSPNLKYVISVGEQHDMVVNVWDWKSGSKHGTGKISAKVTGLAFSEDGSRFVTVGNRSVRFWYMAIKSKTRETVPLNSRSGILGEQRNNFFCSVACGLGVNQSKTYAVTKSGLLCEFSEQRLLDKWVELRTTNAYCIVATDEHLFVGCTDGIVRLFSASTLNFVATLPRPHFLGVNVSEGIDPSHMIIHSEDARFPAVMAITCDDVNKKITCIYNDHSMYVWDIRDLKKIGKQRSFLYHSSCIWGAEVYPSLSEGDKEALPPGSFLTYASDDTIRIWNVDPAMNTDTFKRNIYSNELLKVIYVDDQLENLCNVGGSSSAASDKGDSVEGKTGIRCVSISSDGQLLASGDRSGNVRVHDMQFMDEVHKIEAHDSEVLCLEFSRPDSGYYLLSSASRDRLIHVFNVQEDCSLVQTIDDHSSSITAVKFTQSNGRLQMISCGADKALMFRVVTQNPDFEFIRNHHVVGKTTIYDLTVDPTEKYVATACQDRNIRIHNAVTGKLKRTYKGSLAEDGTLIRVEVDPSGMYIATSCSDKSVAIFDFYSGECVATMGGHSELVTGIKFTNDCKHLISTSGDGCIFVWRLPWGFTHNMKERLNEIGQHMKETPQYPLLRRGTYVVPPELMGDPSAVATEARHNNINNSRAMASVQGSDNYPVEAEIIDEQEDDDEEEEDQADWQAKPKLQSTTDLPLWAKKQVCGEDIPSPTTYSNPTQPRGRWAQRLDSKGFKVKSEWDAHRDIELKMEECIDRRRYTVEPEALADQVRHFALLHSAALAEAEKIQNSLTIEEVDEFVSAEEGLAGLEAQVNISNPLLQGFVTSARGSDPFLPPTSHPSDALMSPDTPDDDQGSAKLDDEVEEEEEEEANDVIIYPPSEESITSPESLQFQVTESTSSMEELQRRRARSFIKHEQKEKESPRSSRVIQDEDLTKVEGSESTDPVSLGTSEDEDEDEDDDEEEEEDEAEAEEESKQSMEDDPSSTSPSTSGNNTESAPTSQDSPSPDQDKDEESFLHTNFTFAEKEKFGKCLEQLQSGFASVGINNGMQHRLSISSKFLSRSQSSHLKSLSSSIHTMPTSSVGGVTAQVYLQRRKDVMARAVDETRRRLQSMGWKSLSLSSKSTASSSSSSSTATTTPVLTPTSPKKSLHTSSQEHSKEESLPVNIEPVVDAKKPVESSDETALVLNERDAPLENINKGQDSLKLVDTVEAKTDSPQTSLEMSDVNKEEVVKGDVIVTEESGQVVEMESNKNIETKELQTTNNDIPSSDQSDTRLSALTDYSCQASLDVTEVSSSDMNVLVDVSISRPSSRSESIISSDSQSSIITSTSEHLPIIKGKRSATKDASEAVEKANKENLERTSKYESHQSRRSISSGSRSKVERMKARKDQASVTTMRKTTSMSDLREASKDEDDDRTEAPTFNIVLKTHPRSHSVERKRIRANSPAREKHRARAERVLPNVPNILKPKSYEIGTTSSRAKKSTRKESDTPPLSPSRVKRKKRPSLGGPVEGSKSEETSPETESATARFTRAGDTQSAKDSLVEKTQQQSESAVELTDKTSKDQLIKEVVSQIDSNQISDGLAVARSTSPRLTSDTSSQQDIDSNCKDSADALAMPPPTRTTVGKSSRTSRRSSASKAVEELRQRKRSSSNTPPPTNENTPSGDQKSSSDSVPASDNPQVDSTRSPSSRRRVAAYREKRSNSLNLTRRSSPPRSSSPCRTSPRPSSPRTLSPCPTSPCFARKGSAPVIKVEFKQNGGSPQKEVEKPSPRRRRREKSESSETNVSNNNNTTSHADNVNTSSPRTQTRRRRSSLNSERSSSPKVDHSEPARRSSSPRVDPNEPAERSSSPRVDPNEPAERSSSPKVDHSEPAERSSSPRVDPNEPAERSSSPRVDPNEPAERSSSPRVDPNEPVERSSSPRVDPNEPAERSSSPRVDHSEPAERSSSPKVDHLDREVFEAAGTTSESIDQDPCKAPGIRVPSPEGGSPTLTFDMMKAKVDTMKTAFDQCLDLCNQIRCAQGENHQHFFNYFNSTFSQMQAATSTISSTKQHRRLLNPSVTTDDTLSDVSESSLPYDEVPQSFSSGIPTSRQSVVSPTDINALKSSLASCQKMPANGITVEGETTSAVALLDHYSDILVSLVRQKMGDEVSEETTTTETQQTLEPAL